MIARLTLRFLEVALVSLAIAAAASATRSQSVIEMAIAGMAVFVAAQLHALASSQARGRRFDAAVSGRRPAPPSNDPGGL